jgi:transposase
MQHIQNIQPGDKTKGDFHFSKPVYMKKIVKQVAAIDVAKDELVVCLGRMYDDWTPELYAYKTFPNHAKGFQALLTWVNKHSSDTSPVRYLMEATGVYHESAAYFLDDQGQEVSVILPNKISNYMRTLDTKTITDKTASEAIARFGLERKIDQWKRPKPIFKQLRQLTRERDQVVAERTIVKNQLHAERSEAEPNKKTIVRLKARIKMLTRQEQEIKADIAALVKNDPETKLNIGLLGTIPGIGALTATIILAETNGFELIRNKRQLASYAGFDVKEKQSGTSVRGKAKISKQGNKYLRKALYLPALAAIRSDQRCKAIFSRIISKNGIKMKAAVAVQRKVLEMTYTIFKKQEKYDRNYFQCIVDQQALIQTD